MSPRRMPFSTHAAPQDGFTVTPCCGTAPTELPRFHGVTPNLRAVTCRGTRTSPVRELIAITLTGTRLPGTPRRRFLPHGDNDGHVYDERCALCAGDVRQLTEHTAAAVAAAFPTADVRNLRSTVPRSTAVHRRGPLCTLIETVLTTTPVPGAWPDGGFRPHGMTDGHTYDRRCALCAADADILALAIEGALARTLPRVFPRPIRTGSPAPAPVQNGTP